MSNSCKKNIFSEELWSAYFTCMCLNSYRIYSGMAPWFLQNGGKFVKLDLGLSFGKFIVIFLSALMSKEKKKGKKRKEKQIMKQTKREK